jgi:hypothetical protein
LVIFFDEQNVKITQIILFDTWHVDLLSSPLHIRRIVALSLTIDNNIEAMVAVSESLVENELKSILVGNFLSSLVR